MNNKPVLIALLVCLTMGLSGCQFVGKMSPATPTAIPATATLTQVPTFTPTATATPLPSPTPTETSTPTPAVVTIPAGVVEVPILMYHHVSQEKGNSRYNISPEIFAQQIAWLHENQYQTINVSDLAGLIRQGGEIPLKPVIITFDDGNLDVYENAFPVLQKYGYFATFYVVRNYVGGAEMVSREQLLEMHQNGWEIGSHSYSHADLTFENTDLVKEILGSKTDLEQFLGIPVTSFAYPFGKTTEGVVNKTCQAGFTSAVGLGSTVAHDRSSIYYLSRIEIMNEMGLEGFKAVFQR